MGIDMFTGFGDYNYQVMDGPARVFHGSWWYNSKHGKQNHRKSNGAKNAHRVKRGK